MLNIKEEEIENSKLSMINVPYHYIVIYCNIYKENLYM